MIRWFEHHQVYTPSRAMTGNGSVLGPGFEDVSLAASDGVRLNGWFFAARSPSPRAHLVLLFFHGSAGNIGDRLGYYAGWLELGLNVFALDYRGYGSSEGRPGEAGTYLDAQAAYEWVRTRGFRAEDIVVLGESLGGGVASDLAVREPIGGLILQSTFTSIPDIGAELFPWLPVRWMNTIKYDTRAKLPRIHTPLLIVHSRQDSYIRFHHAERNLAAAQPPKLLWEVAGGHTQTLEAGRSLYLEGLERYLQAYF